MVLGRELPAFAFSQQPIPYIHALEASVPASQLSRGISNFYGNHIRAEFLRDSPMNSPFLKCYCEFRRYVDESEEI